MWSFGNPKSSTAVIIIAILLFAEINAIVSLKLQSINNNGARRNPLTADAKCCPDIVRRRTKRFIRFHLSAGKAGAALYVSSLSIAAAGVAGAIGASLGLGAALFATGIGNFWKEKTGIPSSQNVHVGSAGGYYIVPMGSSDTYYWNGGNNRQHHHYYFLPPFYYYYG